MATEVATLRFEADTRQLDEAQRKLNRLNRAANDAEGGQKGLARSTDTSARSLLNFKNIALAAASALGTMKLIEVQREFDVINASLITVTGSTQEAAKAFEQIKEFAATTPYDLQQVSNAFVRLSALGLEPSEEALRSYGNTAAAMGKDLIQMIEAVADASTMEFERLKEFGIKAKQQTDTVSFTFRGLTTTVGKNSQEIQDYLLAIGQTEFAGAMEQRAATLDGAISNLGDSFDQLFLTISGAGAGNLMETATRNFTAFIDEINFQISRASDQASEIELVSHEVGRLTGEIERYQNILENMPESAPSFGLITENIKEMQFELAKINLNKTSEDIREFLELQNSGTPDVQASTGFGDLTKSQLDALEAQIDAEEMLMKQRWEQQIAMDEAGADAAQTAMEERWEAALMLEQTQRENMLRVAQDALDMETAAFAQAEEDKLRIAENTTNSMMALGDVLLKGKSEQAKAAFAIAMNLMNKEKLENAKTIISDSYVAAMKAYASLAGIPFVGPALGAAAAGTVLAAGASYATQSLQGRALGGQVRAGESYVVGERGPEVLTMGGMSGNITPNNSITNNNKQTVNRVANVSFQVVANDTAGFDELLQSRRGQIIGIINEALNDSGRSALV